MSSAQYRHHLNDAQAEVGSLNQAWASCREVVRGATERRLASEFVEPYQRDLRRALAACDELARVMAQVEASL